MEGGDDQERRLLATAHPKPIGSLLLGSIGAEGRSNSFAALTLRDNSLFLTQRVACATLLG